MAETDTARARPAPSTSRPAPSTLRLLARGLTRRCAVCGGGRLFRRWFTMVPACGRCGHVFEREEGFFLGAFVVNFAVVEVVAAIFIAVGFAMTSPDPPVTLLVVGGVGLSIVVPLLTYPFSKTTWAALDLIMRKSMGESYRDIRQPGYRPRSLDDRPPVGEAVRDG